MTNNEHSKRVVEMIKQVSSNTDFTNLDFSESIAESIGQGHSGAESIRIDEASVQAGVQKLSRGESLESKDVFALEAIILPNFRPVIDIANNSFNSSPAPWGHLAQPKTRQRIVKAIPSVGRLEVPGHPFVSFAGTGFVVGENLLMTNRHVAELFATGLGQLDLSFISGQSSFIDFRQELNQQTSVQLSIERVQMIHPHWDMALLVVSGMEAEQAPLKLSTKHPDDMLANDVVVVGYPAKDPRNDQQLQDQIFRSKFGVKRLQPGKLRKREVIRDRYNNLLNSVTHDASTLGGNSGSIVLDITTGEVVGLHFAGKYLKANYAVPTFELARDPRVVEAGVNFSGSVIASHEWDQKWSLADGAVPSDEQTSVSIPVTTPSTDIRSQDDSHSQATSFTFPLNISISIGQPRLDTSVSQAQFDFGATTQPPQQPAEFIFGSRKKSFSLSELGEVFSLATLERGGFDWKIAVSMAAASKLAYERPATVKSLALARWGFDSCHFIENGDTQCFFASSPSATVVSFRGSEMNFGDWLGNLKFFETEQAYGKVHRGFLQGFQLVQSKLEQLLLLKPGNRVFLTGHSLGGALALIAAIEWLGRFPIQSIYTFGQPAVGKSGVRTFIDNNYGGKYFRFVNDDDVVPKIPPNFVHAGRLFHFSSGNDLQESVGGATMLALTDTPMMNESQFQYLQSELKRHVTGANEPARVDVEAVEEGFFPSISDHAMDRYIEKTFEQSNSSIASVDESKTAEVPTVIATTDRASRMTDSIEFPTVLTKEHHVHIGNGRFKSTNQEDLQRTFAKLEKNHPKNGLVVHFHGGLVDEGDARDRASFLLPAYAEAGTHPLFFLWESGHWETLRNNILDIAREPLFRKLTSYLLEHLLGKLGIGKTESLSEGLPVRPHIQVENWLNRQNAKQAPFDHITSSNTLLSEELTASESELLTLFKADAALNHEIEKLNEEIQKPVEYAEWNESGIGYKSPGHLTSSAQNELLGVDPGNMDQRIEEFVGRITLSRVAMIAARIGYRVLRRFMKGRDHGLYTTVVEEVARDLYIDDLGSALFWNQLKRDTSDAFGDDPKRFGGTAFLEQLAIHVSNSPSTRVTLVGHSAGAIFISNLLLEAHKRLPENIRFDVVLLAPAVDFELFNRARKTRRIRNIRIFGLTDMLESQDALLDPYSKRLKYVYPKSLLYFVTGLLETEVDRPIVGMQRYYTGDHYSGRHFSAIKSVKKFLKKRDGSQIWSHSAIGPGLNCDATHHGDFDSEDHSTLESVKHILRHGFRTGSSHSLAGSFSECGLPFSSEELERGMDVGLESQIDDMSKEQAIKTLHELSKQWLPDRPMLDMQIIAEGMANQMPSAPLEFEQEMSNGELARSVLRVNLQNEIQREKVKRIVYAPQTLSSSDDYRMPSNETILYGLQQQIGFDQTAPSTSLGSSATDSSFELAKVIGQLKMRVQHSVGLDAIELEHPTITETESIEMSSSRRVDSEIDVDAVSLGRALAELQPEDLAMVIRVLQDIDAPKLTLPARKKAAANLVNSQLDVGKDIEDLLVDAHLVVPSAGLLQQFMVPTGKISSSLQELVSTEKPSDQDMGMQESGLAVSKKTSRKSLMTIRLKSEDSKLGKIPGLEMLTQFGTIMIARGDYKTLEKLAANKNVISIDGRSESGSNECVNSMPRINAINVKGNLKASGENCLVAVIDGGIDIFHMAFRNPDDTSKTRFVGVWDMKSNLGTPPEGLANAGGTWHSREQIESYLETGTTQFGLSRDDKFGEGHGTHVASIAAGSRPSLEADRAIFPGGVAHDTQILMIVTGRREFEEDSPDSLGYSESHIAALKLIEIKAKELNLPVVVNISQGQHSGGHDGTTALEVAIDEFCDNGRAKGAVVVKSAGNDRDKFGHAYLEMTGGSKEVIEWISRVPKNSFGRKHDLIEFWFEPSNLMSFMLVNPDGETSRPINFDSDSRKGTHVFSNGNACSFDYRRRFRDNGQGRLRLRIRNCVVGNTHIVHPIRDGKWTLEIINHDSVKPQKIHAWVERTDWQPVSFVDPRSETTLSIPGTARSIITVAAVEPGDMLAVGQFSGMGMTRDKREKPDIAAPGVDIVAAQSGTEFGFVGDSGTSMAAPHVTGGIALLLSACNGAKLALPSANDIIGAFKNLNESVTWNNRSGHGLLDVKRLLDQFLHDGNL